jgi:acetyl esterase/lipase
VITAGLSGAAARGWSSGASGTGTTDGTLAAWRGSPLGATSTWVDTTGEVQRAAGVADYRDWQGDLDIAVGGTAVNSDESYAQAASGAFDARWTEAGRNIQAARGNSQGTTYLRPWHEFNGSWYANWQVTPSNLAAYKQAFARYVGILRAECPRCQIVWSPNDGSSTGSASIADAYPGDDLVDVFGPDTYNADGNPDVVNDATWTTYITQRASDGSPWGIETWRQFAEQHGKPIAIPEWGLKPVGGDSPEFIKRMNAWMAEHAAKPGDTNLAGKVIYDVYFNVVHGGDAGFTIYGNGANPNSGAAYAGLRWGAQASYTTTSATPAAAASTTPSSPSSPPAASGPTSLTVGQIAPTAVGIDRGVETLTNVQYVAGGSSAAQTLDLYLPQRTTSAGAIPVVAFLHGGAFSGGDKSDVAPFLNAFLDKGYAVASINYRLSGDAPFPAGLQDAKAAVRYLRATASTHGIDPTRIGAFGTSAGGYMAAALGVTVSQQPSALDDAGLGNPGASSAVQAAVSFYGPTDFLTMNEQAATSQCMGTPQDHDAADSPESILLGAPVQISSQAPAAKLTSWIPTAKPGSIPPFLLVHGTADCLVPSGQSEELAAALQQAGGQVTLDLIPGASHADSKIDEGKLPEVVAFFDRTLAAGSSSSDL